MQTKHIKTILTNNNYQQNDPNHSHDDHHLHVCPPLFALQFTGLLLKLRGAMLEGISTVVQLGQFLVSLEHFLNIYAHNSNNFVDFGLRLLQSFVVLVVIIVILARAGRRRRNLGETLEKFCVKNGSLMEID